MIAAFIQARMSSTRLPGKVLRQIAGRPMLWHLWQRLSRAETLDRIVVATSDRPENDAIVAVCSQHGIPCFRGSEDDLVDRIYQAAVAHGADTIVSVTGDCPLVDPEIVDRVVREYQQYGPDLCATSPSFSFPDGFGIEAFAFDALKTAHAEATASMEREHLTVFIRANRPRFQVRFVENTSYHPFTDLHLSVDDEHDFTLVTRIFEQLLPHKPMFHFADVVEVLRAHPEWVAEHPGTPINEGYFRSFFADATRPQPESRAARFDRSTALLERAKRTIPSCTQTFSKGYTQYVQGTSPIFIERGAGGVVYDVDGNEYIDYPLGLGAVSLGHSHPEVTEAVIEQARKGPQHSLPHRLEVELAERLCEAVPCAEMVRFGKNGSDATSAAVRVARAVTGREKVVCCGYHGWQDWYIGTTSRRRGVPRSTQALTLAFPYNDLSALERLFDEHHGEIAAVVMEPVGTVLPDDGYLAQVRALTSRHGALLVFDEIVTGFRLAFGGAQQYFSVVPDLACVGKGMANGYPVSAVVGRRDVMEEFDRCFFSATFGGEAVSLAASLATLRVLERDNAVSHMWVLGRKLKDGYNYLARRYGLQGQTWCQGLPPRSAILFKDRQGQESLLFKAVFQQECIKRGVLFSGQHKTCLMHTNQQIEYTIAVYDEAFHVLKKAYESGDPGGLLEGPPPEPVFRKDDY